MSPDCLSTLIFSLGLSATTGKGDRLILWDEFYRMLLVMGSAADKEINRTFVLIEMKNEGRSLDCSDKLSTFKDYDTEP
ncbi:hypothetical protein [Nostoc sp.]|uniref:hypothetical protein n=1 Tax=Nostoc sp. TaxID=1180 RepID=UPI002FF4E7DB